MIQRVLVFETKGKQFPSVKAAINHREGLIEAFIRNMPGFHEMPAKHRIAFIQSIIDNRKVLMDLFDYDIPKDEEDEEE